jgi:tetratricopeptide (TPR) repeat protein
MTVSLAVSVLLAGGSGAQSPSKNSIGPAPAASSSQRAVSLAETGHCTEALPLLRKSIHQVTDPDLKKRIGLLGLNCAMTQKGSYAALEFLTVLQREFPRDPEVLYAAAHALSDLSLRASKDLVREAPFSYQVYLLNAEALETQGKTAEAATEYRRIIAMNPLLPGMHARLGRVLLSGHPTPEAVAEAKKNFEEELAIDPHDAAAEYVIGELSKDENDLPGAVQHYTRAIRINADFTEAYLGLGSALVAQQQFAEAIPPLEKYEKLAPDSPTGHYQLALAYNGVGRKDDANREAALQREAAKSLEQIKRRVSEGLERQQPHP